MALMSTCLARLGSRYSMILDQIGRRVHYGALGLMCQTECELVAGVKDVSGVKALLPLCRDGGGYFCADQHLTMTSVRYEMQCLQQGLTFVMTVRAPFWPRDQKASLVPAYIVEFSLKRLEMIRWQKPRADVKRKGRVVFGLRMPGVRFAEHDGGLRIDYPVRAVDVFYTGEGGGEQVYRDDRRKATLEGRASDRVVPLEGAWRAAGEMLEIDYDLDRAGSECRCSVALVGFCGDSLFERFGTAMPLKYTTYWKGVDDVVAFVRRERQKLAAKCEKFDKLIASSALTPAAQSLAALSFQSYLMCTLRAGGKADVPRRDGSSSWSANGVSYHHAMPVEENSNYLIMLYAHGKWWGKESLYSKYAGICRQLAEYLIWADSTGNGFPDRGTANTIDDANPAVRYGRDNVYLGVKRIAALHAAARIHEHMGEKAFAARCNSEVKKGVRTLNRGWKRDHYPVVLDPSTKGLLDSWNGKPLPYDELPGRDGYSLYTTNGLLYLMMIDDLPAGMNKRRLREDLLNAVEKSMTPYGCSHSSYDPGRMWISMNIWRDCVAAYLGIDMGHMADRYWAQQVFGNSTGAEKPNCFTETSLANNLVWYPRGAAVFGLLLAGAGLKIKSKGSRSTVSPVACGNWPLLPLADWSRGTVPVAVRKHGERSARVIG